MLGSNKVNYWTGEECKKFEVEFALWLGCKHAIAVMNGTVAIEVALRAIGVSVGDEVVSLQEVFVSFTSCHRGEAGFCGCSTRQWKHMPKVYFEVDYKKHKGNYLCAFGRMAVRHG